MSVFVIEKAWIDWMENVSERAFGYSSVGFVETEVDAKEIVETGGVYTQNDCWAIRKEAPIFRYVELKPYTKRPE